MNFEDKKRLKGKILNRYELYKLQDSRLKRLLKDPARTFIFYILQTLAYVRPYKITHKTLWGATMSYYLPEGSMIYYYGFFEANLSNFLINFLKEEDIVFDIGAHIGFYSVLASDLVGTNGKVFSFEPTPRTFATLQDNAKLKHNIHTENVAILNKSTTIDFYDYGPKYSVFNTSTKRVTGDLVFKDKAVKISVPTISLDVFRKEKNVKPIFIKIDAEGAEHLILESMSYILENDFPLISLEVSTVKEWEADLKKALKTLEYNGYSSYEISKEGFLSLCDSKEERAYDNLIFVHDSKKNTIKDLVVR
jgi:FkbM family methyltransferase